MNTKTKSITTMAMLMALICVATMIIQLPVPGTREYIHPGDCIIFLSAIFFGKKYGLVAGGFGSALADLLSGFGFWAPWTLIIKGLMGFVVGSISGYQHGKLFTMRNIFAMIVGTIILVGGYFIVSAMVEGKVAAAITGIPSNGLQGLVGMILFFIIGYPLDKLNIKRRVL